MEANELRIGNVIQCALNESLRLPDGVPHVVSAILPFGEVIVDLSPTSQTTTKCPIKHCSGIPLTPEWLERAAFEKNKIDRSTYYELSFGNSKLMWYDNRLCYGVLGVSQYEFVDVLNIKHVHQLQNLYFALTGTELEFK